MVCHQPNRQLALTMWLLIDGCRDSPFFKVGRHFREKIGGNQLCLSGQTPCPESPANRKTIDCIHIESGQELERDPSRSKVF